MAFWERFCLLRALQDPMEIGIQPIPLMILCNPRVGPTPSSDPGPIFVLQARYLVKWLIFLQANSQLNICQVVAVSENTSLKWLILCNIWRYLHPILFSVKVVISLTYLLHIYQVVPSLGPSVSASVSWIVSSSKTGFFFSFFFFTYFSSPRKAHTQF